MRKIKVVIPKGTIYQSVAQLFIDAGFNLKTNERVYRPVIDDPEIEVKIMRPQNIPRLIELGAHDVGFTGYDWVMESAADVVEVMDLGLDPVKIVAAVPRMTNPAGLKTKRMVVASEYESITRNYLKIKGYNYIFLRTYGATEVFPPDDADMIIDNTSTGRTLKEHNLKIIDTIMESSTRFIANKKTMRNKVKHEKIIELKILFQAVLDARIRVMLEMNVPAEKFEGLIKILPAMRAPTVASLYKNQGYAVKVAVKRNEVARLIPKLKKYGATDILEYEFRKVVV